jgi:RpiB/LacA/LacB family sugar-phosphate isomerase
VRLAFGSDHAGFDRRRAIAQFAVSLGHTVTEHGAQGPDAFDYPIAADKVAGEVLGGRADAGVLICGTGIGVSIRAGIRAALCCSPHAAELARQHNHANVLCLGARTSSEEESRAVLAAFLQTPYDEAERHVRRAGLLDGNLAASE